MNALTTDNPFVGLRPFESDEDFLFFGRDEQILELMHRLHEHHFVAVIGSSGSGKSSLIKAGLIPGLEGGYLVNDRDRWLIASMKPGQDPICNLAGAVLEQVRKDGIGQASGNLVEKIKEEGVDALLDVLKPVWDDKINFFLLVDQFEELFRFFLDQKSVEKKDEATDFVNILLTLAAQKDLPVYIVITMRSDFIGDCTRFFGLPEALNQSQYLVPRLNRTQLKATIEGPVRLYKGKINPGLTARLLNDAQIVKDELPLLQHALMRTWDHEVNYNKNGELDIIEYESIGGIGKALSNHADEALTGMSGASLLATKKIFQALTTVDENGRKVRRPVKLTELEAITGIGRDELLALINRFIEGNRSFLVINKSGEEKNWLIDISHESLIRQWGTLNEWVEEETESAKNYLRLVESSNLYHDGKKDLMAGSELHLVLQWNNDFEPKEDWAQRYNASFEQSINYLRESEREWNRAEKNKKRIKRNQSLFVIGVIVFVIVALTFYTIREKKLRQEADRQYQAFRLNALAQEWEDKDPTIAFRLEEAAIKEDPDSIIISSANRIYARNTFYKTVSGDSISTEQIKASQMPDETTIRLWKENGKQAWISKLREYPVQVSSRDGRKILVYVDSTITVYSLDSEFPKPIRSRGKIYTAIFSPDGAKILGSLNNFSVSMWNDNGISIADFKGHTDVVTCLAFSKEGTTFLTGSADGTVRLWRTDGALLKILKGPKGPAKKILSVGFSEDGTRILTRSDSGIVKVWNDVRIDFNGHTKTINKVAFSPDNNQILTGSEDAVAHVWNLKGDTLKTFINNYPVDCVAFAPDSGKILTSSGDSAILWDKNYIPLMKFRHSGKVIAFAFSPNGKKILTGSRDSTARLWDLAGNELQKFELLGKVYAVAFSSDGNNILIGSGAFARLWVWNGKEYKKSQEFKHAGSVYTVTFSKDGKTILTGSADSTAKLIRLSDNQVMHTFRHNGIIESVAFSPDGTKVLTGSHDFTAKLWGIDGTLINSYNVASPVRSVVFSPDGRKIFIGADDGIGRLYSILPFEDFLKGNQLDELTPAQKKEFGIGEIK